MEALTGKTGTFVPLDGHLRSETDVRTPFHWTEAKFRAAVLLFEGKLSSEEIAKQIGKSARQIRRWKREPQFIKTIDTLVNDYFAAIDREFRNEGRRVAREMYAGCGD